MFPFPFDFAGVWIDGAKRAPERRSVVVWKIRAAVVGVALFVGLRRGAKDIALLSRGNVEKFCLWIVRRRHPIRCAGGAGADAAPFRRRRGFFERERAAFG